MLKLYKNKALKARNWLKLKLFNENQPKLKTSTKKVKLEQSKQAAVISMKKIETFAKKEHFQLLQSNIYNQCSLCAKYQGFYLKIQVTYRFFFL